MLDHVTINVLRIKGHQYSIIVIIKIIMKVVIPRYKNTQFCSVHEVIPMYIITKKKQSLFQIKSFSVNQKDV